MKKIMITYCMSLLGSIAFCQDTAAVSKANPALLSVQDPDSAKVDINTDKPHAEVNKNIGTSVPSTTSGTLNSSVNPNTQFVIPFGKSKAKAKQSTPANTSVNTTDK